MKLSITKLPTKTYTDEAEQALEIIGEKLRQAQESWNAAGRARPFIKANEIEAWNKLQEAEKFYYKAIRELETQQ
jgi:hypothetical protein